MISEEEIKKLAFTIWEQEGHPQGKDQEHYLRAKQILEQQEVKPTSGATYPPPVIESVPSLRPEQLPQPSSRQRTRGRSKKT